MRVDRRANKQHKENGMRYQGILQESELVMEKVSDGDGRPSVQPVEEIDKIAIRCHCRRARATAGSQRGGILQGCGYALVCLDFVNKHIWVGIDATAWRWWKESTRQGNDERRYAVQGERTSINAAARGRCAGENGTG